MYCDYYGFREKPFNITPDPGFIFLSAPHNEAFAHLLYGIDSHVGFIALTGEVGAGKTTVVRTLLGQLGADKYRTALIFNPCLSSLGLMQSINREYGLSGNGVDTADLLQELNRFLLDENAAGRTVVLVVDEAQNLAPTVLEQIRLISNLETERDKLIQIVLVGQPELRELLRTPELRQLGQRIGVKYHLGSMNFEDTREYVRHRTAMAGRRDCDLFTLPALRVIYGFSGGLPRLINLACDRALLLGYTREQSPITTSMARTAINDVRLEESGTSRRRLAALALLSGLVAAVAVMYGVTRNPVTPSVPPTVPPVVATIPSGPPPTFLTFSTATRLASQLSEKENALAAFNTVAGIWRVAPAAWASPQPDLPEVLARERGLDTLRFTGHLAGLLRFDVPAILELSLPGVSGRRYLALIGVGNGQVTVAPPLGGRSAMTAADLERLWSGRAWLPWKNHLAISSGLKPEARGVTVKRLQGLLHEVGVYRGGVTGVLDRPTLDAITSFQTLKGVEPDGTVGRQTLFLLYRAAGHYPVPTLSRTDGGRL